MENTPPIRRKPFPGPTVVQPGAQATTPAKTHWRHTAGKPSPSWKSKTFKTTLTPVISRKPPPLIFTLILQQRLRMIYFLFFKKIYVFIFLVPCSLQVLILVPSLGIEPMLLELGTQSLNHWTTKEDPKISALLLTKSLLSTMQPNVFANIPGQTSCPKLQASPVDS